LKLVEGLNTAQREAATTTEGPLLVLAGAGTGKTRVITFRIVHLLDNGVAPGQILAVTFTNKAAREMRERVESLLGNRPKELTLSTFHSLGMKILREHGHVLGYRRNFTIYDTSDQSSLVRTLLRDLRGATKPAEVSSVLGAISRAKSRFILPAELLESAVDAFEDLVARVYERYQEELRTLNCADFDDLILLPVCLLKENEDVRRAYQLRWRYLLVDEYQDTNHSQYELLG
jgi:superfamily I DNA/RNA helicase